MLLLKKPVLIILITIAGIVFGFIFLLKSCLAKYDERFIKSPALVFEKNGKAVVFSIVEFQKTTSYSQKGGMTSKSVNTMYYVQINDGETADLITSKKIKNHREIKNYPIEILGSSGNAAWLFMGEPMAFDPFTLDKIADLKILEEKNKSLADKFPVERQFYSFNKNDSNIYFTAKDGSKWKLSTRTLLATPSNYKKNETAYESKLTALANELKNIQILSDSLYQQKSLRPAQDYAAKKITYQAYQQINKSYYPERERLSSKRDSIGKILSRLEKDKRKLEEIDRNIENLNRSSHSFSQIKSNQDTLSSQWLGLYSDEEFEKLSDRVNNQSVYDETALRKLLSGTYSISPYDEALLDKPLTKAQTASTFLAGGFLLNKQTGQPIHLPNSHSRIIVHKDQIGREGKILLTVMSKDFKAVWTYNTILTEWTDWILSGNKLFVFGVDNKNLSSGETNILICLNLDKMTATRYDYFKKKKTE